MKFVYSCDLMYMYVNFGDEFTRRGECKTREKFNFSENLEIF